MNVGKVFEEQIKKSVPDYALLYRLPDSAQSFGGGNLRFSNKNPFDFLLWDSSKHILFSLELKTLSGNSISFERSKDEQGEIHYHQIKGLNDWNKYDGITCGFIIEFREISKTVFIEIDEFNKLIDQIEKKSFSWSDLQKYAVKYLIINQEKKRTRYTYDIESFLNEFGGVYEETENSVCEEFRHHSLHDYRSADFG